MAADHHRVSKEGRTLGRLTAAMAEEGRKRLEAKGLAELDLPGLRNSMCASCACRAGTIPNGCLQTQLDLLKSVVDGKQFLCHAPLDGRMCAGAVGVRAVHVARPLPDFVVAMAEAWEYSPADDADTVEQTTDFGEEPFA